MDAADEIRALYRDISCATFDLGLAHLQATGRFISLLGRPPTPDEIAAVIAGRSIEGRVDLHRMSHVERPQRRRADFALSARGLTIGRHAAPATSRNRARD
jgi:hypothetical protein